MVERCGLGANSFVVELASNDGYLLQYFVEKRVPVLGIEPAANVAEVAKKKGVPTLVKFFGRETARELAVAGKQADLLLGNNVLAQVPDLNDFVAGVKNLLKPPGGVTIGVSHPHPPVGKKQVDTNFYQQFFFFFVFEAEEKTPGDRIG